MKFKESQLATELLTGLKGLEVGGSAHNPFGLFTLNVDRFEIGSPEHEPYASEQRRLCGEVMPVNIVAPGDNIPVPNKSYDFVISSHVIEHFFDPIAALKEWERIATKYIYIICPLRDALESDKDKPLTELQEHIDRHDGRIPYSETDEHHSRWTPESFVKMCLHFGFNISHVQQRDDKVGNGFAVVIKLD